MSKRQAEWWRGPVGLAAGFVTIVTAIGLVYNSISADANMKRDIKENEQAIEELEEEHTSDLEAVRNDVEAQEQETEKYYQQQQLIQQDLGYLKESQKEILNALKKR